LEYVELRCKQGSKISIFGTGIAFNEHQVEKKSDSFKRWTAILNIATDVQLRGPLSQETARAMGIDAKIFGDFVFSLYDPNIQKRSCLYKDKKRIIGINVGDCLGDQLRFEEINIDVIKELSKDFQIHFFIVTAKDEAPTDRVVRNSGLSSKQYKIFRIYIDPIKFMKTVVLCNAFIGVKLHATGLAMICGIPTLSFEYLPKCRDFILPINLEQCLLKFPLEKKNIENKIEELLRSPDTFCNIKKIREFYQYQKRTISSRFS